MKVVINDCYGGFCLSEAAYKELGLEWDEIGFAYRSDEERADPKLVKVVEELGKAANGEHAYLKVVEIPDGVKYTIENRDGNEWIAEVHRTWS